jgi:hypothetical protein
MRHAAATFATNSISEALMFSFLLPKRRTKEALLRSLAQEIANACRQEVRLFVADRCSEMSVNEMRGYARARAAEPVRHRALQRARDLVGLSPRDTKAVLQMATDHVVGLVVGEGTGVAGPLDARGRAA